MFSVDKTLIERKFADRLYTVVDRFKIISTNPYKANFRCDVCGDSKKSRSKARAYVYENDGGLHFKCHNCDTGMHFSNYLKTYHTDLYQQYVWDIVQMKGLNVVPHAKAEDRYVADISKTPLTRLDKFEPLKDLVKISKLNDSNSCRQYVISRKIPTKYHHKLYYCEKFFHWINETVPNKFGEKALKFDEPRLVIPFIDENGYCFGVTGRSLAAEASVGRYITILFDDKKPKIFGLDTVDFSKKIYVLEGAIDSMFVENSLAFNGISGDLNLQDYVLVLDNEPRNKEVLDKYAVYIARGCPICIWPSSIAEKDVNMMILAGQTPEQIKSTIDANTRQGMLATLAFNNWKKLETRV